MKDLSLADFSGRIGTDFVVEAQGHRLILQLTSAIALDGSPRASGGFQLEFLGPADPVLAQGIFPFEQEGERYDLFVGPIGRDAAGTRYDCTFF